MADYDWVGSSCTCCGGPCFFISSLRCTFGCDFDLCDLCQRSEAAQKEGAARCAAASGDAAALLAALPSALTEGPDLIGRTAMHYAAENLECTKLLLTVGADPQPADASGLTPSHLSAACGSARVLRELLRAGAPAEAADRVGRTPLHMAAGSDRPECVAALLEAGADPDALDRDGYSALHVAAAYDGAQCVRLMLEAGADPERAGPGREKPLECALVRQARDAEQFTTTESMLLLVRAGAVPVASLCAEAFLSEAQARLAALQTAAAAVALSSPGEQAPREVRLLSAATSDMKRLRATEAFLCNSLIMHARDALDSGFACTPTWQALRTCAMRCQVMENLKKTEEKAKAAFENLKSAANRQETLMRSRGLLL
jgi:hypothetical protein